MKNENQYKKFKLIIMNFIQDENLKNLRITLKRNDLERESSHLFKDKKNITIEDIEIFKSTFLMIKTMRIRKNKNTLFITIEE